MPCCEGQICNFLDVIHFQSRIRHYEDGRVRIAWNHHPTAGEYVDDIPDGADSRTNFSEFCESNVATPVWDEAGEGYWHPVFFCLGQHPFKIEDLFEELEIELTPEEDGKLNNCSLMLFVGVAYVWDPEELSELTPGLDPRFDDSIRPKIAAVATAAGSGELVKVIWSDQMWEDGYFWSSYHYGEDCGGGGGGYLIDQRECVWDEERPDNNLPNYRTEFLLCSTQPTSERVVFMGVPASKRQLGPGPTYPVVVSGGMVQVRDVKTGEVLFDGAVEAEAFRRGFIFTGDEYTLVDPPIADPPPSEPSGGEYTEEEYWYPALLKWAYATNDKNLIGCLGVYANRSDTEAFDIDPPEWRTDGLPYYAGMRLVTFSPFPANPFLLREVKRSPLDFNPSTTQPTFGPDDSLWVTGFWRPYDVAFDDPAFEIEYGVWAFTYSTIEEPEKVERLSNVVGSLSQHCEEVYGLGKEQVYDPETDELGDYLPSTRTRYYEGPDDDPEPLSLGFNFNIGYYGWEWGFWSAGGTDFFSWDTLGWGSFGVGYSGWNNYAGISATNYLHSPIHWSMYVVADMTDGGDRDKFEFAKVDNTQVMTNPCLATCADGDLGGGGEDCSACDCEDDPPPTWYSVTFGEPTCEGLVGVTVNPLTDPLRSCAEGQCGPLNGKFKYFFTTNEDNDSPCSPWPGAPDGDLPEVECGDTFFIPIPPPSYITVEGEVEIVPQTLWVFAVDDCGCYVIGCAQFPAYICPLDIDYGDAHDNDIGFEMLDNCFQAAEQCVATFPGMFVGGTYGSIGYTTIYPGCEGATVELLEYNLIEGHTGSGGGQNLVGWCDAMEEPMIWTNEDGSITVYRCGEFYSDVIDPFADPVQEESSNTDYYVALVIRAALIVSGEQACEKEITVLLDGTLP